MLRPDSLHLVVVMPLRDDWEALKQVVPELDRALVSGPMSVEILVVDDFSLQEYDPAVLALPQLAVVSKIHIVRLRRNLGHQRAICVGLSYVREHLPADAVLVMDADGEDLPADAPRLLSAFCDHDGKLVVFAARQKRSEGFAFAFFYHAYRHLHRLLTGVPVRVGNFSVLPMRALETLLVVSEAWNHFAAAVVRAKIPHHLVPTVRGLRRAGRSRLNFTELLIHGLSAYAVFADVVTARVLSASVAIAGVAILLGAGVVGIRLFTDLAIPGWTTVTTLLLALVALQMLTFAGGVAFVILVNRNVSVFLPIRDCRYFIEKSQSIHRSPA